MNNISSLNKVHLKGLYGDYENKDENNLIKIKEIKNINLFQVVKYKSSKENILTDLTCSNVVVAKG